MSRLQPLRFRAPLLKAGVNPYVEIPTRVSQALTAFTRAARIRVAGELKGVPFVATLVPVRSGGHRLYVPGGIRSAAEVSVGDVVSLRLRGLQQDEVPLPPDLNEALQQHSGADAFEKLPAARRRELLRYVDDARTPEARQRRIEKTIAHALGAKERRPRKRSAAALAQRPLWTCPRCGNAFVNRNQWHSCRRGSLQQVLAEKPPEIRELFDRFRRMVEACGPVRMVPYPDHVGFMVRVRFARVTPKSRWMDVGFWLTRRLESPRFRRVETLQPDVHLHSLQITKARELDAELAGWIREAYAIGCQEHLR